MASGFYTWSQTSNDNATADGSINMAEGMAPSGLNDGVRAAMARLREWGNDIAGAIVTTGSSTAYTVASNQAFDTLAHLNNQVIAFTPHVTNDDGPITLSVDGLTAKPLRPSPGVELPGSSLILGTPYVAIYNNTDGAFYLQGGVGAPNAYSIPLGAGLDYWLSTTPNSLFAFAAGQAISRTTYAALFAAMGTTYGSGDGSTTFNLPDMRGRVAAALDNLGGTAASRLSSYTSLGHAGGEQTHTLTLAETPADIQSTQNQGFNVSVLSTISSIVTNAETLALAGGGSPVSVVNSTGAVASVGTVSAGNVTTTSTNTSGGAHNNIQPTIACGYILRVA